MDYNIYLEDLERRIDVQTEESLINKWTEFADGNWSESYFSPKRSKISPATIKWPDININDALEDDTLMIINQFAMCSRLLESGSGLLMFARSNYGVGIMPSLYGVDKFIMPYETNTLPNVLPLKGGIDRIKEIIDNGDMDLTGGWSQKVFNMGEMLMDIKDRYPKIGKYIRIDHPDCQGPMDICELLWGSEIFYDLYDKPELVHALLRNVTNTYKSFLDKWFQLSPNTDNYHAYFGALHRGNICVRDDSAMNLSPTMFDEFIFPYDQELFTHFDGGCIHYCGRGEHFISRTNGMNGLTAINLSQPHLNDMNCIFDNTVNKGLNIIGLDSSAVLDATKTGRDLHGLVHTSFNN